MQLIDGKATAAAIKAEIKQEVEQIMARGGKQPHLAAVLVGHDGGSETYVKNKVLACEACGFKSTLIRYEADVTEPTCTEAGYTTYTCKKCGASYTDDRVEPLGHDWDDGVVTKEEQEVIKKLQKAMQDYVKTLEKILG